MTSIGPFPREVCFLSLPSTPKCRRDVCAVLRLPGQDPECRVHTAQVHQEAAAGMLRFQVSGVHGGVRALATRVLLRTSSSPGPPLHRQHPSGIGCMPSSAGASDPGEAGLPAFKTPHSPPVAPPASTVPSTHKLRPCLNGRAARGGARLRSPTSKGGLRCSSASGDESRQRWGQEDVWAPM